MTYEEGVSYERGNPVICDSLAGSLGRDGLSRTMYQFNDFRKSTSPQNRQLVLAVNNKLTLFGEELTFQNHAIDTFSADCIVRRYGAQPARHSRQSERESQI